MSVTLTQKYVKSPLNYVGGKYRLLPQILPHFPNDIGTFVDLFAGGCNVSANVESKINVINDKQKEVIELLEYFYKTDYETIERDVLDVIKKYGLVRNEKEAYLMLRKDYNDGDRSPQMFYTLICHSFNHQIRFNKLHKFNMPVGLGTFNSSLRENLKLFSERIKEGTRIFESLDFRDLLNSTVLNQGDFVYCDPPYLITTAPYNEQGGWSNEDEKKLLSMLDELNGKGIKFALSNVLLHKGRENIILGEWAEKYKIIDLNYSYATASYHGKNTDKPTREVLVTNY